MWVECSILNSDFGGIGCAESAEGRVCEGTVREGGMRRVEEKKRGIPATCNVIRCIIDRVGRRMRGEGGVERMVR